MVLRLYPRQYVGLWLAGASIHRPAGRAVALSNAVLWPAAYRYMYRSAACADVTCYRVASSSKVIFRRAAFRYIKYVGSRNK